MRRRLRPVQLLFAVFLSLPLSGQAFGVEASANHYRNGTLEFKAGNYSQALDHFRKAVDSGNADDALLYNLGVTHYKLAEYRDSRNYFEQLLDKPEWAELARYNLGLVLRELGEEAESTRAFRHLALDADNEKIRYLASQQLHERVESEQDVARSAVLLGLSAGYDSNVIAFPEQLQESASLSADSFTELLAYGQTYLQGQRGDGYRLHGYAFSRRYGDLESFDTSAFSAELNREHALGDWIIEYGIDVQRTAVDGETLATRTQLVLGAWKEAAANRYSLGYRPGFHAAGDAYPQLEGYSHRFDAKWRHNRDAWRLHAGYRLELNDREDLAADGMFFSYSPVRHRVEVKADWIPRDDWRLTAGARFEHAEYADENRLIDTDGELRIATRESDFLGVSLRGEYDISREWQVHAELRHDVVDDTFELYSYDRNTFMIGVDWLF